jgi:DNA ligase-1
MFKVNSRDLGETIYYLDVSKKTDEEYSLQQIFNILTMDCAGIKSNSYSVIDEVLQNLSALERKWFVRYWLSTPRNGINEGMVKKVLARAYDKKIAEVKQHCNFNDIRYVVECYEMNANPPCDLRFGRFISPMLAKSIPTTKWPSNKIVDFKYDGNRYQIHKKGENVIIFNRKGKIITYQFKDIVDNIQKYPTTEVILDGEIYPINEDGSPAPHKKLATRVHSKDNEAAIEKCPVRWVMFDILMRDGETIMQLPYSERIEKMEDLPDQAHRETMETDVIPFYNQAINDGFEGIIVKDPDAPYEAGKRSSYWAKYKPPRIELDVAILSARYGDGARSHVFGSFDIGVKDENGFVSIGSIGTGFSDADLLSLTKQLRPLVESYEDTKYIFLPRIVLEITADLVSKDAKGNIGLRFPRMMRIRDDKYVNDINTLEEVIQLM